MKQSIFLALMSLVIYQSEALGMNSPSNNGQKFSNISRSRRNQKKHSNEKTITPTQEKNREPSAFDLEKLKNLKMPLDPAKIFDHNSQAYKKFREPIEQGFPLIDEHIKECIIKIDKKVEQLLSHPTEGQTKFLENLFSGHEELCTEGNEKGKKVGLFRNTWEQERNPISKALYAKTYCGALKECMDLRILILKSKQKILEEMENFEKNKQKTQTNKSRLKKPQDTMHNTLVHRLVLGEDKQEVVATSEILVNPETQVTTPREIKVSPYPIPLKAITWYNAGVEENVRKFWEFNPAPLKAITLHPHAVEENFKTLWGLVQQKSTERRIINNF